MSVRFLEEYGLFWLDTAHTSYVIKVVDEERFPGHVYYGKKIRPQDAGYLLRTEEPPFVPSRNNRERAAFYDQFPFEYGGNGVGDYRESAVAVEDENGCRATMPLFTGYEILPKKPGLPGLPATFDNDGGTLILHCGDAHLGLEVDLLFSVFEREDVIARSVIIRNAGERPLFLEKALSMSLDMDAADLELLTLHGGWGKERQIDVRPIGYGRQSVGSLRGETSHQEHPFLALKDRHADQNAGEVYGFQLVYSGNFLAQVEKSQMDSLRVVLGIHPEGFGWELAPGGEFYTPEALLTYSDQGLGGMSRAFHDVIRDHLIRSAYRDRVRPVLINNWEATYFDFNTDRLLSIAECAAKLGIEMLVMDDGWFGRREDDSTSLGDWTVNEEKLPGGLKHLVERVNALGLKFGIWIEPEMVSPDSDLYRAHPDWAIQVPGREPTRSRNQYVLDLTRQEVRDYAYGCVASVLRSANIEYVKWDMNRQLTDLGSVSLPGRRMGEFSHRYVLGVYEMQERLLRDFPDLLLENCSGGGARFDAGMLYYSPQIWCSDDTDAIERLKIQEGTALAYPLSAMGAHVSACPNHEVGRVTPFETRGYVALAGTFGYELDITGLSPEERDAIPGQVALYHRFAALIQQGDYYRIASCAENHEYDCYMVVSKDKKEALVTYVQVLARPNCRSRMIRLKGLDPDAVYLVERVERGETRLIGGDLLMEGGIALRSVPGDFRGQLLYLKADE